MSSSAGRGVCSCGLLTFGGGYHGRLGHGDLQNKLIPTRVAALGFGGAKIVMVTCGSGHSMAKTASGDVYTWGSGEHGCSGLNDEEQRLVPTMLDHRTPWRVKGGDGVGQLAQHGSDRSRVTVCMGSWNILPAGSG